MSKNVHKPIWQFLMTLIFGGVGILISMIILLILKSEINYFIMFVGFIIGILFGIIVNYFWLDNLFGWYGE